MTDYDEPSARGFSRHRASIQTPIHGMTRPSDGGSLGGGRCLGARRCGPGCGHSCLDLAVTKVHFAHPLARDGGLCGESGPDRSQSSDIHEPPGIAAVPSLEATSIRFVPSRRRQPIDALTEEQKRESRRTLLRGTPVTDPELAAIIVRTSREARRSVVPIGIAIFAVSEACGLYLYFGQGFTGWFDVLMVLLGLLGTAFWVLVWLVATRAIRRNMPLAQKSRQAT
jgi:hypothetical protein